MKDDLIERLREFHDKAMVALPPDLHPTQGDGPWPLASIYGEAAEALSQYRQQDEWRGLSASDVVDVITGRRSRRKRLPKDGAPALDWLTWFFDDEMHADTILKALREEGFEIVRR